MLPLPRAGASSSVVLALTRGVRANFTSPAHKFLTSEQEQGSGLGGKLDSITAVARETAANTGSVCEPAWQAALQ